PISSLLSPSYGEPRQLHSFPTRRSSDLLVRIDLEHLAHHRRRQRLVALARGCRVDRDGDGSQRIDVNAAGLHPRRGGVLLVEQRDRKSTRLNSSHVKISYAVFCLKKKKI